jgi:hypothetical protein
MFTIPQKNHHFDRWYDWLPFPGKCGKLALLYPHDVGFMLDLSAKNDWIWI